MAGICDKTGLTHIKVKAKAMFMNLIPVMPNFFSILISVSF